MLISHKSTPGPSGTSCLTCKRRHKKCDQRRPVCETCEKSDFECLGYSHNKRGVARSPLDLTRRQPIRPKSDTNLSTPNDTGTQIETSDNDRTLLVLAWEGTSEPSARPPRLHSTPRQPDGSVSIVRRSGTGIDPGPRNPTIQTFITNLPARTVHNSVQHIQSSFKLHNRVPYSPYHLSKTFLNSSTLEDYATSSWNRMATTMYFKPAQFLITYLNKSIVSRLRVCRLGRWMMFIFARVSESFAEGDNSYNTTYNVWISQMDQVLKSDALSVNRGRVLAGDWLGMLILRAMVVPSSHAYQVIRTATPMFLQMVYSDPTLWPSGSDPAFVPLVNIVASPRHEFSQFVLVDSIAAMVFGLPQHVEYDTSCDFPPVGYVERAQCFPAEFQILLVEINACRDKSLNAQRWEDIEHKLMTWQGRPVPSEEPWESWMAVAWFAMQESWRHALLIYLYMAVCGTSSDDPRVQSSIRQILQISRTIKKEEAANPEAPFFIQHLMVGVCARSEKHRSMAREKLATAMDTRLWLLKITDFVPVLDDLWHGAAADGRPIKWRDYIRSREKVLPVSV